MKKYKEIINYVFWGLVTTLVNWSIYSVCVNAMMLDINISNIFAWIGAVLFAYFANKVWVFHSKYWKIVEVFHELVLFVSARVVSGVAEIGGFALLIYLGMERELFGVKGMYAKLLIAVIVIIMNYILSKFLVFRKVEKNETKNEF